jgi:hypothetical protein
MYIFFFPYKLLYQKKPEKAGSFQNIKFKRKFKQRCSEWRALEYLQDIARTGLNINA